MSTATLELAPTEEEIHLATTEIVFKRILVATDFSKPAARALKTAVTIAQIFGSELTLVHAALPYYYGTSPEMTAGNVLAFNLEVAQQKMDKLIASDPELRALDPETIVEYGDVLDVIIEAAHDEQSDLIIVGSHGASGVERLALGSVAECVLRRASCPVLIIGPHCQAEPFPFRSILFATDLATTGLRAAQYATGLAERFHGRITLLHVVENRKRTPGLDPELLEQRVKLELARLLPGDVDHYSKTKLRVEYGIPSETIADVARQEAASMVVVGLQERGALADHVPWSTLSHLTHHAHCIILGVRGRLT